MVEDAQHEGVEIHYDSGYQSRQGAIVQCSQDSYEAGYIVNAAGLYADHIARDFGFSEHYRILPSGQTSSHDERAHVGQRSARLESAMRSLILCDSLKKALYKSYSRCMHQLP